MAFRAGALGGRYGDQLAAGGARGSARAAARRVPQGTKAGLPALVGVSVPRALRARLAERGHHRLAR